MGNNLGEIADAKATLEEADSYCWYHRK